MPSDKATIMLHRKLQKVMEQLGYSDLLPVQKKSIPFILAGYNVLVVAPTGSGKTEAALFPLISQMLACREKGGCREGVLLVYITPLRALNRDIENRIRSVVEGSGFSLMVRHGDTTPSMRKRFMREAPDVMITTPESLNLLLTVKSMKVLWKNVRWVVVDEIHEFIDSERGSELAVILERLEALSKHRIQRVGLSATISERTMRRYAAPLLGGYRHVEIVVDPSKKTYKIWVDSVGGGEGFWRNAAKRIVEIVESVSGKVLVFVNTRGTAERLAAELSSLGEINVAVHHGSLSRAVREKAERDFKYGDVKVLVATSSMELGIDIGEIELVIQFLSPRSVITMTQRAGRSGHRFGETSRAVIITSDNLFELLESSVIAFRTVKGVLEDQKLHLNPLDALAHQIAALVLERESVERGWLYSFFTRIAPFRYLGEEDLDDVVYHLDGVRVVRLSDDESIIRRGGRIYKYFYKVSMIPDERNYTVHDVHTGEKIGELSERFVEAKLLQSKESGRFAFVLAGKMWEALDVDPERGRIEAKLIGEVTAYIPSWEGELIPVDYRVAREVCSIVSLCMENGDACRKLLEMRGLNRAQIEKILRVTEETRKEWDGIVVSPTTPVIEPMRGGVILYTCLGSKGNFALALLLSMILRRYSVETVFDYIPYAIVFTNPFGINPSVVKKALIDATKLDRLRRQDLIETAVKESIAFKLRFIQVAKRMGVVDPDKAVPWELVKKIIGAYKGTVVEREALREIAYDKLDYEALNLFLENINNIYIVKNSDSSLSREVMSNPYLRKDKALDIRRLALDVLIESYKKKMKKKKIILLCATCGYAWERTAATITRETGCPKCGSRMVAVLPATEWGRDIVLKYRKYLEKIKKNSKYKPRGETAKILKEVRGRATLFLEYYRDGMIPIVVEALSAPGIGPVRARRVIATYIERGERDFYKELFRLMEEYIANRKYWKSTRKPR